MWEHYKNLDGDSGVDSFEIGGDYIDVKFRDPSRSGALRYKYSYSRPGATYVERMKVLARQGSGLNSYIKLHIGKNFERKW